MIGERHGELQHPPWPWIGRLVRMAFLMKYSKIDKTLIIIRGIPLVPCGSRDGIGDRNVEEWSSTGVVLGVNLTLNYASWAIAWLTNQIQTCSHKVCAQHNNIYDWLRPGWRARTPWFGHCSLRMMKGTNTYIGMECLFLMFGWWLGAPCVRKKHDNSDEMVWQYQIKGWEHTGLL